MDEGVIPAVRGPLQQAREVDVAIALQRGKGFRVLQRLSRICVCRPKAFEGSDQGSSSV